VTRGLEELDGGVGDFCLAGELDPAEPCGVALVSEQLAKLLEMGLGNDGTGLLGRGPSDAGLSHDAAASAPHQTFHALGGKE
jgi:hypothetical protein